MTQAQIYEITKPNAADVIAVKSWINSNGCSAEQKQGKFNVGCTVANAEKLFQTQFLALVNNETAQASEFILENNIKHV